MIDIKHPGLLHKKLGVPQGQPIPASKVESAAHSSSPALRKEADFALAAKHFHHGGAPQNTPHHSAVAAMIRNHGK